MSVLEILVTGASGKQGGAVARALLARGHKVRALSRNPESPRVGALQRQGAVVAVGGFDDAISLERAIAGTDAVFAMSTPFEAGPDAETRQGVALVDAARKAGTKHFVYTSIGTDQKTGIAMFESKHVVEKHLVSADLPYTIVGPVFFMENLIGPRLLPGLKEGKLAMALPAARKLQQITVEDIGKFAATVIEQPDRFRGKRIDIASDELSFSEAVEVLSRATGRKIGYIETPLAEVRSKISEDYAKMFDWFDRVGYKTDIAGLRRAYPEVGWHSFEAWAKEQDWKTLLS